MLLTLCALSDQWEGHNQFNILQGYGVFVVGVSCTVGVRVVLGNGGRKRELWIRTRCWNTLQLIGWLGLFVCFGWLFGWWVASEYKKRGIKTVTIVCRFFVCRKWAELILSVFYMRKLCLVSSSCFVRHLVTITQQVYISDYLKMHKYHI